MNFELLGIREKGKNEDERVVIKVLKDTKAHYAMIFHHKLLSDGKISNQPYHTFWFSSIEVKANDLIVLYTKKGSYSVKNNKDGTTSHFFYWNINEAIFKTESDSAVLIGVDTWVNTQK